MSRFERQAQIYEDIQRLQSEIDACPHSSPEYLPLLKKLNEALAAYQAVPSDEDRRQEINARLDHIQATEPSPENTAEFFALCKELRELPKPTPSRPSPRQMCFQLRWLIWIEAVVLSLMALAFAPGWLQIYMYEGVAVFLIVAAALSLAFAVWASTYRA